MSTNDQGSTMFHIWLKGEYNDNDISPLLFAICTNVTDDWPDLELAIARFISFWYKVDFAQK